MPAFDPLPTSTDQIYRPKPGIGVSPSAECSHFSHQHARAPSLAIEQEMAFLDIREQRAQIIECRKDNLCSGSAKVCAALTQGVAELDHEHERVSHLCGNSRRSGGQCSKVVYDSRMLTAL